MTPSFAQYVMRVMSSDETVMSNLESGIEYTFGFYQKGYYLELHAYWEDNDVTVEEI